MTNHDLIEDPQTTLNLLGDGIGHFMRLVLAGYVERHPEMAARMTKLLNSPDECATLTARLAEDQLRLEVGVLTHELAKPRTIAAMVVNLPALTARMQ